MWRELKKAGAWISVGIVITMNDFLVVQSLVALVQS